MCWRSRGVAAESIKISTQGGDRGAGGGDDGGDDGDGAAWWCFLALVAMVVGGAGGGWGFASSPAMCASSVRAQCAARLGLNRREDKQRQPQRERNRVSSARRPPKSLETESVEKQVRALVNPWLCPYRK